MLRVDPPSALHSPHSDPAEHSAHVMRHCNQISPVRSESPTAQQVESFAPQEFQDLDTIAMGLAVRVLT